MKLLRVRASGFRNCADDFTIDLLAKSKKTSEDKEYELLEIDEELYVYSTMGIVGKNASGKTSALELLDWCYDILSTFRLSGKECSYHGISMEIIFYQEGYLYLYTTELDDTENLEDRAVFKNQSLHRKKYYKSKLRELYTGVWDQGAELAGEVPEDFSILYFVLKKAVVREIYYEASKEKEELFGTVYRLMDLMQLDARYVGTIMKIFDSNITDLRQIDETHYSLRYQGTEKRCSSGELFRFLSSGTTKGFNLYILAVLSLKMGFDLLVDEIENHFHRTLVENLIMLYKDKQVNKKNATLIFSTHYCELLDLFNRSDNIWVTHSGEKMEIVNLYETYGYRPDLLKSKKFYQNAYDTAVNYEALMELKKELMQ